MIGALAFIAMSCSFVIFSAWVSESEPPNTVKSLANTNVLRPLTVPQPVTTPSPGTLVFSMPNSVERCSTNMSNSSKLPLSSRSSIRSRAVSLPRACCAAMRFSPPPSLAPARRSSRVSRISFMRRFQPTFEYGWFLTRSFPDRKRPTAAYGPPFGGLIAANWQRGAAPLSSQASDGDKAHGGHGKRGDDWRGFGWGTHPAPPRGVGAAGWDDRGLQHLGRSLVALFRSVPGSGSEFPRLCRRAEGRRLDL